MLVTAAITTHTYNTHKNVGRTQRNPIPPVPERLVIRSSATVHQVADWRFPEGQPLHQGACSGGCWSPTHCFCTIWWVSRGLGRLLGIGTRGKGRKTRLFMLFGCFCVPGHFRRYVRRRGWTDFWEWPETEIRDSHSHRTVHTLTQNTVTSPRSAWTLVPSRRLLSESRLSLRPSRGYNGKDGFWMDGEVRSGWATGGATEDVVWWHLVALGGHDRAESEIRFLWVYRVCK